MKQQICKRAGIRHFVCDECNFEWEEPTRDCFSPSGEPCLNCYEHCAPVKAFPVEGIYFDERGKVSHKEIHKGYLEQYPQEKSSDES